MSKLKKILENILRGDSDANVSFKQMGHLLEKLGFNKRVRGDHHIFNKDSVVEILNLQPKSSKAKPYQVKQVRNIIIKYKLGGYFDA